jgi:hypothetical protein
VSEGSSAIVPPIVVAEGWDATFHRTEADVLAYYEPWFPGDALYRAFDSEGRRLDLVLRKAGRRGLRFTDLSAPVHPRATASRAKRPWQGSSA